MNSFAQGIKKLGASFCCAMALLLPHSAYSETTVNEKIAKEAAALATAALRSPAVSRASEQKRLRVLPIEYKGEELSESSIKEIYDLFLVELSSRKMNIVDRNLDSETEDEMRRQFGEQNAIMDKDKLVELGKQVGATDLLKLEINENIIKFSGPEEKTVREMIVLRVVDLATRTENRKAAKVEFAKEISNSRSVARFFLGTGVVGLGLGTLYFTETTLRKISNEAYTNYKVANTAADASKWREESKTADQYVLVGRALGGTIAAIGAAYLWLGWWGNTYSTTSYTIITANPITNQILFAFTWRI